MTRVVVDAMGSDDFPTPDVIGSVMAAREYGVEIILVGDESRIGPVLAAQNPGNLPVRVVHAPEMLTMEDKGMALVLKARRPNSRNSMAVGMDLVKNGQADAFVTAGNTGAASVTAYFRLGTIPGVDRPGLAPVFPTATGSCVVIDVGANPDCKPENLLQFGLMGSIYAARVRGISRPQGRSPFQWRGSRKRERFGETHLSTLERLGPELLWQRGGQGSDRRCRRCGSLRWLHR